MMYFGKTGMGKAERENHYTGQVDVIRGLQEVVAIIDFVGKRTNHACPGERLLDLLLPWLLSNLKPWQSAEVALRRTVGPLY